MNIAITCETEGAEIRYTLDESDPTESDTLYQNSFEINPPFIIKAKAFKEGMRPSGVSQYLQYFIPSTVPMTLPDGSVLFYDRGEKYGCYLDDGGYPIRKDGEIDDETSASTNWRYLICDKEDAGFGVWSEINLPVNLPETVDGEVGYGLPNTNTLVNYSDNSGELWESIKTKRENTGLRWFLPALDELGLIYQNKESIESLTGITFKTDYPYWSSTTTSRPNSIRVLNLETGESGTADCIAGFRDEEYWRLIRRV